ncbi:ABC transporter ATP-binding protein [Phreatobacter aquaticus]|uniref:ABC transporter ATP-binding protein n=2 Tax=Phreatobacter aquaticus TaxID=2570229 RepID=A0A4D7QLX5_9HYPH|nr:ABC transporter ATP-binding protein [Phreatobacter aquaticus]
MPPATEAEREPSYLAVSNVIKRFGASTVLDSLSLAVGRAEFVSLLGPSGCGKTTLLRLIAGLLTPDQGAIEVGGRDLTRVAAHRRNIGVVFQNYALFPHLTVAENIAYGLKAKGVPRADQAKKVTEALGLVRMEAFADRAVTALSGGQQQRIAVARAIVVEPSLLLLDEPFSALDRKLRETMQIELRHILRNLGITSIFVTHDQDEALVMSDRIAVMNEGRIEHLGTPSEVYARPKSLYTMEFVGQSSRIAGVVKGGQDGLVEIDTPFGLIRAPGNFLVGSKVVVGVRPEAIAAGEGPASDYNMVRGTVAEVIYFGSRTLLHFRTSRETDRLHVELNRLPDQVEPGTEMTVRWRIEDSRLFPAPAEAPQ